MNFDIINTDPLLLFFGSFFIVLGLSAFFAVKPWEQFIDLFIENKALSLILGILVLPYALYIMFFYNNWETIGSIVLMVVGYMIFIKSLFLLLLPNVIQTILTKPFVRKWLWLDGLSGIILGLAMLVL